MKIVRWAAVVAFLIITANLALADGVGDPRFQTIGGGGSGIVDSLTGDPNFVVNYTAGVTTLGSCAASGVTTTNTCFVTNFINHTGQTWTSISFLITGVGGDITQDSFTADNTKDPYFLSAALNFDNLGRAILSFFGTDANHPGIQSADINEFSCSDGPETCTGPPPFIPFDTDGPAVSAFDFGILVDVENFTNPGDSFTAQGSAAVPEPKSIFLLIAGAALVGFFLSKRATA
jgi:hypothetical protein